jgi:hypothetical protein
MNLNTKRTIWTGTLAIQLEQFLRKHHQNQHNCRPLLIMLAGKDWKDFQSCCLLVMKFPWNEWCHEISFDLCCCTRQFHAIFVFYFKVMKPGTDKHVITYFMPMQKIKFPKTQNLNINMMPFVMEKTFEGCRLSHNLEPYYKVGWITVKNRDILVAQNTCKIWKCYFKKKYF